MGNFCPSGSGSGSTDPIKSRSNCDPDPQPCQIVLRIRISRLIKFLKYIKSSSPLINLYAVYTKQKGLYFLLFQKMLNIFIHIVWYWRIAEVYRLFCKDKKTHCLPKWHRWLRLMYCDEMSRNDWWIPERLGLPGGGAEVSLQALTPLLLLPQLIPVIQP